MDVKSLFDVSVSEVSKSKFEAATPPPPIFQSRVTVADFFAQGKVVLVTGGEFKPS